MMCETISGYVLFHRHPRFTVLAKVLGRPIPGNAESASTKLKALGTVGVTRQRFETRRIEAEYFFPH